MKIEEVEALSEELDYANRHDAFVTLKGIAQTAIEALRAEAWYPIERSEEMGVKDGREILVWDGDEWWDAFWHPSQSSWWIERDMPLPTEPTHFKRINPPEAK